MNQPLTVECSLRLERRGPGARKVLCEVDPASAPAVAGQVPRLARWMALAIRFDHLVASGAVRNYAELARLGHVSRARITQITNLRLLAPDIQEAILFLPNVTTSRAPLRLAHLQPIAAALDWTAQRRLWQRLCRRVFKLHAVPRSGF